MLIDTPNVMLISKTKLYRIDLKGTGKIKSVCAVRFVW